MTVTVVILTKDRPNYLVKSLASVVFQTIKADQIVVSDNSTPLTYEVNKEIIGNFDCVIEHKYRGGRLSLKDHILLNYSEITSDYFVLFHDDDILYPDYLNNVVSKMELSNYAAVGVNGVWIDKDDNLFKEAKNISANADVDINSKDDLVRRYIQSDLGGSACFSGYMYNKKLLTKNIFDINYARYYFDTIILMNLLDFGQICWISKSLIKVRVHETALSNICGVIDYKGFINYALNNTKIKKTEFLEYHYYSLINYLKKKKKYMYKFVVIKFVIFSTLYLILVSYQFRKRLIRKIIKNYLLFQKNI